MPREYKLVNKQTGKAVRYVNIIDVCTIINDDGKPAWELLTDFGSTATYNKEEWQLYELGWVMYP